MKKGGDAYTHSWYIQSMSRLIIGVSEENADKDACEIEHKINRETAEKLTKFIEFIQSAPQTPLFLKHFRQYDRTGKRPQECKIKGEAKKSN